jgi:choline dehydrogenase
VIIGSGINGMVAAAEVVLAMGAMHTPKVLMLSGIGGQQSLRAQGIPVIQHLPGVGRNFQNHVGFCCVWETPDRWAPDVVAAAVML